MLACSKHLLILCLFASITLADVTVPEGEAKRAATVKPSPGLSPVALQLKLSGRVELGVSINEQGAVTDVRCDKGSPVLCPGAVDAVKRWKFTPFTEDGKPAKASTTLTFEFKQ